MRILLVIFLTSLLAASAAASSDALAPYAEWKRNGEAERLLSSARELALHWLTSSDDPPRVDAPEWRGAPTGLFVTLMRGRSVRACVGEIRPSGETLVASLAEQCRRLARDDLRHSPLSPEELPRLRFVVTLTDSPAPLNRLEAVDIWNEGVLAEYQDRAAVLLPGEAKTLSWGVNFLLRQLGVSASDLVRFYRFPVAVFSESDNATSPRAAPFIERFPAQND